MKKRKDTKKQPTLYTDIIMIIIEKIFMNIL